MAIRSQSYSGLKEPVRYRTLGNITLSGLGTQNPPNIVMPPTLPGGDWTSPLSEGDRILVADQTNSSENGIYTASAGPWQRARDANKDGELTAGTVVTVAEGYVSPATLWVLTSPIPVVQIGTTPMSFFPAQGLIYVSRGEIDQPNGVAGLDSFGKISPSAIPPGGLNYKGTWDANTNTPALADGTGTSGDLYVVSIAGTQNLGSGSISFSVGDFVIYNAGPPGVWEKISTGGGGVSAVNGQSGVVVLNLDDINDVNTSSGSGNLLELDSGTWRRSDLSALGGSNSLSIQLSSSVGSSSFAVDPTKLEVVAVDVADNATGAAPNLRLVAKYDADPTPSLTPTSTHYPFTVGGEMTTGGASPAGNMTFGVNGTTRMRLTSAGQLQLPTNGGTGATGDPGILFSGDALLYRSAANTLSLGNGDKIQQSATPIGADDLTNKSYVDNLVNALLPVGTILDYAGSAAVDSPTGFLPCNGNPYPTGTYPALFAAIAYTYGAGPTGASHFRVPNFNGRSSIGAGSGVGEGTSGTGTISGSTGLTVRTRGEWGGNEKHVLSPAESGQKDGVITSSGTAVFNSTVTSATAKASFANNVPVDNSSPYNFWAGDSTSGSAGFSAGANRFTTATANVRAADLNSNTYQAGHAHSITSTSLNSGQTGHSHSITGATASTGHNNVQPYLVVNKIIKY